MTEPGGNEPTPEQLRAVGLFAGLDDELLEKLCRDLETKTIQPGEIAFREGEPGLEMYIVLEGELEAQTQSDREHPLRVAIWGPGDWFGEMAVLDASPRPTTVRALAPTRLMRLTASELRGLGRREPEAYGSLVTNMARELSRRLRVAYALRANQNHPARK